MNTLANQIRERIDILLILTGIVLIFAGVMAK